MAFKYYLHREEDGRFLRKSHIDTDTDLEPEDDAVETTEEIFYHTFCHELDTVNDDGTITEHPDKYKVKRQGAYPSIGEQLDKLYHDIDNGTLTTAGDFYTALNTVKTDHPKPK